MAVVITEAELLEAISSAMPGKGPANARTVSEMKRAMSIRIGEERIRDGLRELQSQGRLVVHHVLRPRLDGQMGPVPVYEVLPPVKKSSRVSKRR